jgi:hypothetical protein
MTRVALVLLVVGAAASAAATALPSPPAVQRTVLCPEAIDDTSFPYRAGGYRTVLGAFSVPPAYLAEIEPTDDPQWRWWRKAGLVVRADGRPVRITVPDAWRDRVAFMWGNAGNGEPFSSLRIAGCRDAANRGYAYAGGFVVRKPSCVPLTFHVGSRSATVRFGLGKRCGSGT